MKHVIPEAALVQHIAILGKTGSGKTTTGKLCIEQVVAEGSRVCVLDPIKSDWWGLTSSADGKRPGLPFHILGGPRGHVPLHANAGKAIGEIVASGALPLSILDMADFAPGGQAHFFVDFAPMLIRKMRGVVYLVIEEAHLFAPKERSGVGKENLSIHWAKTLATAGRSKGIRLVLITQRTQALHNALLGSCDTMIAHRMTAPADQEPVVKWLKANVKDPELRDRVASSLSSLPTGTGWLCSGEAKLFQSVKFPQAKTYDNTATPSGDADAQEVKTAPVDPEKLRAIIGNAVAEAEANDPAKLRAEIAALKKQLSSSPVKTPVITGAKYTTADLKAAEASGFSRGRESGIDAALKAVAGQRKSLTAALHKAITATIGEFDAVGEDLKLPPAPVAWTRPAAKPAQNIQKLFTPPVPSVRAVKHPGNGAEPSGDLTGPEQRILDAVAWLESITGKQECEQVAVAFLAGYTYGGGAFNNPRGKLNTRGLVIAASDRIRLTDAGRELARVPEVALTAEEMHRRVLDRLPGPEQRILKPLLEAYPEAMDGAAVAEAANYTFGAGAFNNPRGRLRSLGLIEYVGGQLKASGALFPEGA